MPRDAGLPFPIVRGRRHQHANAPLRLPSARARSGQATAALPKIVMKSRRLTRFIPGNLGSSLTRGRHDARLEAATLEQ